MEQAAEQGFWDRTLEIWILGGWGMIPLALISFMLFTFAFYVWVSLRQRGAHKVSLQMMEKWVSNPALRQGHLGELIDYALGAHSLEEVDKRFQEIRVAEVEPVMQNMKLIKVCIAAAPLTGLLGTVTGMLSTFAALGSGGGGDDTMKLVAAGISEALFTTAQGLIIALPGIFIAFQLAGVRERYSAFLEHLESFCMQRIYRTESAARRIQA